MTTMFHIREFGGSQHRAWEELAYQVRDRTRAGVVETRKTRAPDGGVEWYEVFEDGHQEGHQAKFYKDLASALSDMKTSVESVAANRPQMTKLSFVVPFDFTDHASPRYESDQDRWDAAVARWRQEIPGADRLQFGVVRGGDVLDRLSREEHAGRRAFWFGAVDLSWAWLRQRWEEARVIAGERYTPQAHTTIDLEAEVAAVGLSDEYLGRLVTALDSAVDDLTAWTPGDKFLLEEAENLRRAGDELLFMRPVFDPSHLASVVSSTSVRLEAFAGKVADSHPLELLRRAHFGLRNIDSFLHSRTAGAAAAGVIGISGPAGQGKTHLVLQRAADLLASGTPALVLMGQRFTDGAWWPCFRDHLGIGVSDVEEFLGALDALAEASGHRAVIFVDALNESQDPRSWRSEIPSLVHRISRYRWLALAVTWRADYEELVLGGQKLPILRHPGLAGVADEALANYCELYRIPKPIVPVFDPAFTNPLFLHMYCEILAADPTAGVGARGRSQVFSAFARLRSVSVVERLRISPATDVVACAIGLLVDALIDSGGRPVRRSDFELSVNALLPDRNQWPDTLFGQMRSVGLIETMPSFKVGEVVSFPFQAFSEHIIVAGLLDRRAGDGALDGSAMEDLAQRPAFWRAAAVLLPERFGVELIDVLDGTQGWRLRQVTIDSLMDRDPRAFGSRAFALLEQALADEDLRDQARDAVFTLAPRPEHPCNALWLHQTLLKLPMPERDATWGPLFFDLFDESDSFQRLLKWAVRRDDRSPEDHVALAALPLVWVLTTPNRRLRDHTTKALVELLRGRLPVVRHLLSLCERVDDHYLTERLFLIAYGSVMRGGDDDVEGARTLAREVLRRFDEGTMPVHVLARDAGRGVVTWATHRGLLENAATDRAAPPYGADPPVEPPTADELEAAYGRVDSDPPEWRCWDILDSCLDWMGDFNKYVIACDVDDFSLHPLGGPRPSDRAHDDPLGEVDAKWAGRWVAWKAITVGWTPDRFAAFEHRRDLHSGRDAHKPERFGKKYQWLALHELLARLSDNFHRSRKFDGQPQPYEGPWGWFGRDIDPSLACSTMADGQLVSSVAVDDHPDRWLPATPDMDSSGTPHEWAAMTGSFPRPHELVLHQGQRGDEWVALYRHSAWMRRPELSRIREYDRRQWILQFSWLTHQGDGARLFQLLSTTSLFGRWMPERHRPHRAYLGEGPWSHLEVAEPATWEPASKSWNDPDAVRVLPATETYLWEGNTLDCSLDESVSFEVPTGLLLGDARWVGTSAEWTEDGESVVRALRTPEGQREHTILLARSDWLETRLRSLNCELITGILGERQAMDQGGGLDLRAWTEFTSVGAWIPDREWQFAGPLVEVNSR